MKKKCLVVKLSSGLGGKNKGAHMGVSALEVAAQNCNMSVFKESLEYQYPQNYTTENDVPYLKNIKQILPFLSQVIHTLSPKFKTFDKAIVVSGDHSNAIAGIASLQNAFPKKKIGVVWLDAHLDLHNPYTTPSGNLHGMALGTFFNHQTQPNSLSPLTLKYWKQLRALIKQTNVTINQKHLAFLGVRSLEDEENNILNQFNVLDIMIKDIRTQPLNRIIKKMKKQFEDCDMIYFSFDVDVLDPAVSKGTGTPEENGLTLEETKKIITEIIKTLPIKVFEITEINPLLDSENKTAYTVLPILDWVYKYFNKS